MKFFKHLTVQTHNQVGAQTGASGSLQMFNTESLTNIPESANIDSDIQSNYLPYQSNVGAQSDSLPNILDAEVQTKSLWKLFKKGLKKFFCIELSQDNASSNQIAESNVQDNASSIYDSAESLQQIAQNYDIMDSSSFAEAVNQASSTFSFDYISLNGIDTYVLIISNNILSVNPDLITPFL